MKKAYKPSDSTSAPLSGAQEANGFVFVSGQIHLNDSGQLEGKSIEEKLKLVVSNVTNLLNEAGLGLQDVIRVHLYLTDLTELPALNKEYGSRLVKRMFSKKFQ